MKHTALLLCTIASAALATPAMAVIGQSSTGSIATGGNTKYLAQDGKYSGVVAIMVDWGGGELMACSGFLLTDRRSVVTAGHCTSEKGGATKPVSTTVYFDTGADPDANIFETKIEGNVQISVSNTTTHPDYTTSAVDQNDIAVLTLSELAPDWATGYEIYETDDLTGKDYEVVGYGLRNSTNGNDGLNTAEEVGTRRKGTNTYDFRTGEDVFNDRFTGGNEIRENMYVSDFDDGTAANDESCNTAGQMANVEPGKYCDLGTDTEVITISGDSGTPQFVDGKASSIAVAGIGGINGERGSYASVSYYVPLYLHTDFIKSAMIGAIPEPATWMQMLIGFGMLGGAMRSVRRTPKALAA